MIRLEFFRHNNRLKGFTIKGHADFSETGDDIVCASVSSAIMLITNTITDVFKLEAKVEVFSNKIELMLLNDIDGLGDKLLKGALLHLNALSQDFNGTIKITFSEV